MKITANRKEDILKRKAEYEADRDRRQAEYNAQYQTYRRAEESVYEPVRQEILDLFRQYPRLDVEVRVETAPFSRQDGLRVNIRVNDRDVHDQSKALSWNYDAYIDDGELKRETGSWSGLSAVTDEQLEHLEQSLNALKDLAGLDWMSLLSRALPNYKDYVTISDPRYDRNVPDFNKELEEAEIEDIIGQRKLIAVKPFTGSDYSDPRNATRWSKQNPVYIAILKDSGSQYTILEVPMSAVKNGEAAKYFDRGYTHRVKKTSIRLVEPIDIVEV